ncbi:fimbrial biogenesis outer membrane usher protein [Providencia rettgeri]|uniref:fimbria/pilus outer membrane usher protein n=1 Tax=Providencia TaxID=586 RepID=UPI00226EBBD0|nr:MULTISPECIES: fimbria/pilus outer membrane usher protein [Providencia]MCX9125791.1 fimbrial biogenesis outer membrane usher protein [Providencia rettgeri]MCX9128328.1 fimbrial biogenesis outer membrane usher protein [Providencia rettgeri]HEM6844533.1 fimbrial biogenesis outer membrane usher protein [Providencia rettgeri]HEM6858414.1 fimbrial biogenesis outer membrane usher protein [Providencia rettgeri]
MKKENYLYLLILIGLQSYQKNSIADEFETSLLVGKSAQGDISRFYTDNNIPSGKQLAELYVNNNWKGQFEIDINNDGKLISLAADDVQKLNLNLSSEVIEQTKQQPFIPIDDLVPNIKYKFNINDLRLDIIVPQVALKQIEANYVDPSLWNYGEPAIIFSYNTNYYSYKEKKNSKTSSDNFYATLNSGINLGAWQFRDESSYRHSSHGSQKWKNNTRYIYRPLSAIKSGLKLGDFYTPAALFNSIRVRGIALATEASMLPNSSQNFVPIIRGVAQTNALVSVYQNNNLVYQENVPPGEFAFNDLQPSAGGGDLFVVVQEADGRQETFTVPYSAVPDMLKQGVYNYSLIAGQTKIDNTHYQPKFTQGEFHYGLNNLVTLYAGMLFSEKYYSGVIGSGWNFSFGAISADITQANTKLDSGDHSGQSYRLTYNKYINATSTNLTLASYRYSTSGYYSFIDAIYSQDNYRAWKVYQDQLSEKLGNNIPPELSLTNYDALRGSRAKNTFTLNLNQQLADGYGSVFISGTHRDYWNTNGNSREYQAGYANNYNDISYSVSVSRVRNYDSEEETRIYANFSVPFSLFEKRANISMGSYFTDSRYQQTTLSVSGIAGKNDQVNYTLTATNQNGGNNLVGGNVSYQLPSSTLSGSYTEANNYRQTGLGAKGTLVAIPGHIVFSGEAGQTYTIIDAPMASNMMVNADKTTLTNQQGVVLVANSTPYRTNTYTLTDTEKTAGAEVLGNMANVSPYQGAVNYIKLETDTRQTYLIRGVLANGDSLPFGTEITDAKQQSVGYVGQSGVMYIKSEQLPMALHIKLKGKKTCVIEPLLNTMDKNKNLCR